jgi:NADPH:quinone reductase-like Zn-dependent oxidoreductase
LANLRPYCNLNLLRGALKPGELRVRMHYSPVNASDLIPITGAYRHRTPLPAVAGYEGLAK